MAAFLILAIAGAATAQTDPAAAARAAADRLDQAAMALSEADGVRNRVRALSEIVRAFEDGLEAMREGLRRVSVQEEKLSRELQSREAEIAQLLGVLQSMDRTPAPVLLLHPSGPIGTARSGMMLADVTPALTARAEALNKRVRDLSVIRALQESALGKLQDGLHGAQQARTALSQAIANRTELPRRFSEDPTKTAILVASSETLDGFARGLNQIAVDETEGSLPGIDDRRGNLPFPVRGKVLRRPGEADAAGITRPGLVMLTRPRALVSTPAAATLRYRGPLLDLGNVAILEPQAGILLVLAGLDVVYGQIGEVLPGGSPVGLMGGPDVDAGEILPLNSGQTGAELTETLYIEFREDNIPVDPQSWFRADKDN